MARRPAAGIRTPHPEGIHEGQDDDAGARDWEQHPIDQVTTSGDRNPRSASGVEQTRKSLRTSILSRGCENLRTGCNRGGTLCCTSDDDGAERAQTQEGAGAQPV
jgi:hypothetical protein